MTRTKKPKWARRLNKRMIEHIKDVNDTGRLSLAVAKANADNPHCIQCRCIGTILKESGVIK